MRRGNSGPRRVGRTDAPRPCGPEIPLRRKCCVTPTIAWLIGMTSVRRCKVLLFLFLTSSFCVHQAPAPGPLTGASFKTACSISKRGSAFTTSRKLARSAASADSIST